MTAFLLAAVAVFLFIRAHRQAPRTTLAQIDRAQGVFAVAHAITCGVLLAIGRGVPGSVRMPLLIVAAGAGVIAFAARARLFAFGTRRRDWFLRGPFFLVAAILLAVTGPPWVVAGVFAGLSGMAYRWKTQLPTRRLFTLGWIALALAILGFWRVGALPEVQKDALEGTAKALWGFANAMRWSAAFFCATGAFALFVQFVKDPTLGVQRVGRRLALSHVLVAAVPILLLSMLWIATTVLGVSRDRAMVAARALETEANGIETSLRSALADPGDPAPRLRALGEALERRAPGTRVWQRVDGRIRRVHGPVLAREDSLGRWLDSLRVLHPSGVIATRGQAFIGAAVETLGLGGIVLVPADTVVHRVASRIADTEVDLQAGSYSPVGDRGPARDSLKADIDSLVALAASDRRQDSLETERVRKIARRFGVPDSVVQPDRNRPRAGITIDGDRLSDGGRENRRNDNFLLDGYALARGVSERRDGWRTSQVLVRVSLPPRAVLSGIFSNPRKDQVGYLPLFLISVLGFAFFLVALWDVLMVTTMGRGVAEAIGALNTAARKLEAGDLDHRIAIGGDDELWDVARALNQASAGLARARESENERARLENELALARRIQARLLPDAPPSVAGLEIAGASESAREVGGDYFDHIDLGGGRVALVIADVSGKGVPAALLMSAFRASLVSHDLAHADPGKLAGRLNGFLYTSVDPGKFVTAFVGFLDSASGAFHYVNAGHNPPVLLRASGEAEWLREGGTILGILPSSAFSSGVVTLGSGDVLALYTDGVTEGANARGEMWGEDRLVTSLERLRQRPCSAIVRELVSEVRTFEGESGPADDITVLIARRS